MAGLETLANYAEIFGAITVVGGLLFAGIQVRAARHQRRDGAANAMLSTYVQNPVLNEYSRRVMECEDLVVGMEEDPEVRAAVDHLNAVCESIALMVFNRAMSIQQAADWGARGITRVWDRLQPLVEHSRSEGNRTDFDWWEWLATMIRRHAPEYIDSSAMERHGDWMPR